MNTLVSGSAALVLAVAALAPVPSAHAAPTPTCQGVEATIVGTPAPDRMVATPGPDVIVALDGDDVVIAGAGDDLVCGGEGADLLRGGPGDDRLYGQREALHSDRGGTWFQPDRLDGGIGDDVLDVGDDTRGPVSFGGNGILDYRGSGAGVTVDLVAGTATGQGSDAIVGAPGPGCGNGCYGVAVHGSDHDDVLLGSENDDYLVGYAGDDRLDGRGGVDELRSEDESGEGPADADTLTGGDGDDFLIALVGRDVLHGDAGADDLFSLGGPTEVYGGAGDDSVVVEFPRRPGFVLDGGAGDDDGQVWGPRKVAGGGRPTAALVRMIHGLVVASEVDWGHLGGLEVLLLGANMRWTYRGTDKREVLHSTGLRLHAKMRGGNDVVRGTPGNDLIDGGADTDRVSGANGRDRCTNAETVQGCERTA